MDSQAQALEDSGRRPLKGLRRPLLHEPAASALQGLEVEARIPGARVTGVNIQGLEAENPLQQGPGFAGEELAGPS